MHKPFSWSYTALTSFETCPRRHYETKVAKTVREHEGEALLWGNDVHRALEKRALDKTPLPSSMQQWEPLVSKICDKAKNIRGEQKLAINERYEPRKFFDKDVWCRGVVDLSIRSGDRILALDWKTGKRKQDPSQLMLFAALLMHTYREIEEVITGYVWLKERKVDRQTYTSKQLGGIWQQLLPRVTRLESAHITGNWPPKPSGLCRAHCPCKTCEFNGQR